MNIINIPIAEIKPYKKNPRKNDHAVDAVAASIKEFGFLVPMVIDKNNEIVCGHTRYKAAKSLGMKEVPCVIAEELSPKQIKAFRLADNKVSELAEWDFDLLADELNGLLDFDMNQFGFCDETKEKTVDEVEEDDYEVELSETPKAKQGDVYALGSHRLMCGDSTSLDDVEKLLGGAFG